MFRFLYTVCDTLSAIFALISPIAILHWLLKITGLPVAAPLVKILNPIFDPLDEILTFLIKTPPLIVEDQPVSTTQAALAILFTFGFFAFHFIAEVLRSSEQRLKISEETRQQQRHLAQLSRKEQHAKQQIASKSWRIYLQILYRFSACPAGGELLDKLADKPGIQMLERNQERLSMEFSHLDIAFQTCREAACSIQNHYKTLRPNEPQPPFQIGLHALESETGTNTALLETERIARFAGQNQIVFSQSIQQLIEAQDLNITQTTQSLGLYALENGRQEEVFRLDFQR